ncbi:TetR/AcrR family transcriptional regulator C-terminal domain-containing protein [Prescottella defluvii]|nr:TetR/AcrR family transcriptional regulator C-terminal domain-containing protein [Prescottella defluvii]
MLRHPWARQAIESRTRRTPAVLAYMDSVAGTCIAGGFSADLTHHVMRALGNRIWGSAPKRSTNRTARPTHPPIPRCSQRRQLSSRQRYPHIVQIAVAATHHNSAGGDQGCNEQFEFEFAFDLLLDGAERLHHPHRELHQP